MEGQRGGGGGGNPNPAITIRSAAHTGFNFHSPRFRWIMARKSSLLFLNFSPPTG